MLLLKNISRSFPGVKALQDISLGFAPGQVHALCGENGAGKSTLMNIISGNLQPDTGEIFINGKSVVIGNVLQAEKLGIAIVYQERSLVDSLSVAENIFPVHQPKTALGYIDHQALHRNAAALLHQLQLDIPPGMVVSKLSAAQKGMVEIAKALAKNPSVLILDEPTASITHEETMVLFSIIRQLKQNNVAVIYISHRMAEITAIADVVTVLKDGRYQGTVPASTPSQEIVKLMVGRDLAGTTFRSDIRDEVLLDVRNLSGKGFRDISFRVRRGEIIAFAGLTGSGRTALAKAIFGDTNIHSGDMYLQQKAYRPGLPSDAVASNIAYLPDDRKGEGLFPERSVAENITSAGLRKARRYDEKANTAQARQYIQQLSIRVPHPATSVQKLSGGNQQKVVLAKWLSVNPDLLIVNEPTHGVDVGAKSEIYHILKSLTAEGIGIIMISSELPELLLLADHIAVMYRGRLMNILPKQDATEEKIAALASGIL